MRAILRTGRQMLASVCPKHFGFGSKLDARQSWLNQGRYDALRDAFAYTSFEMVGGDFLEFGVARGRSMIYAKYHNQVFSSGQATTRFIGFDSFEGFPKPRGVDAKFERFKEGEMSYAEHLIQKNLRNHFGKNHGVEFVRGFYDKVLSGKTPQDFGIEKIRVINIDCDLYQSALEALMFCTPAVQEGTVILFDDYLCYRGRPDRGEQGAIADWLKKNPHFSLVPFLRYANVGKAFIVNIK